MGWRVKLTLAYLGTGFHGWQRQAVERTVQGDLEIALEDLIGRRIPVVGAGRTDAGVHAAGQVAHFDLLENIPVQGLVRALNGRLASDLRIRAARRVDAGFHARRSATAKHYAYRAAWRHSPFPWAGLRRAVVVPVRDPSGLTAAARILEGCHDMASFTVTDPTQGPTLRTLFRVRVRHRRDGLTVSFLGEGFLRYQVRRMVGVLLEVGWGKRNLEGVRRLLRDPEPGARLWTAPAVGLTLEKVLYRHDVAGFETARGGVVPVVDSVVQE
jgi:tRNA pseudouridine38-40 synthase